MDYDAMKERALDFVKNYYIEDDTGMKTFVYMDQVEEIAQRKKVPLYIMQDHIFEHDPELSDLITQNTIRYRDIFYDVIDKLVAETLGQNEVFSSLD